MKLVEAQIKNFRNILDSTTVRIEPDVTCLVGKNESGKTAFLHALYRLLPSRDNVVFRARDQYPAWILKRDRIRGVDIEAFRPVRVKFLLEEEEKDMVAKKLGEGVLIGNELTLERDYNNDGLYYGIDINETAAIDHLLLELELPSHVNKRVKELNNLEDLRNLVSMPVETPEGTEGELPEGPEGELPEGPEGELPEGIEGADHEYDRIKKKINDTFGEDSVLDAVIDCIEEKIPHFFYFHKYSSLPYTCPIKKLLTEDTKRLEDGEITARALLRLAAADEDFLLNTDYESRKRELENVANALTDDVLKYWSQNPKLRVQPDITMKTEKTPEGRNSVVDELKIRIWDDRHFLSLPFDEHSTGFQWFFSFLAAFSEYENRKYPVVILLDEPALGLHARAQADFLRFIDERLADRHQVIYTTHSPFMVQPSHLERVRMVEDKGRDEGAIISSNILTTDRDTLFPLQGALGYDLVQHLFIAPYNLIVEGTSDYTYVSVISDFLGDQGREYLDKRWSIIPIGGADLIPTFVSLLGHHLDVTVVVDSQKKGHQKLSALASEGYLAHERIITIGQVLNRPLADIEDLFSSKDYLILYNKAFGKSVKEGELKGTDPIVKKLERFENIERYNHGKPADIFLRHRTEILEKLSDETLSNFEKLFKLVNLTLE